MGLKRKKVGVRRKEVGVKSGRRLGLKRKEVGVWTEKKKIFPLLCFICHINIGGVKYGKKIKISINKKHICRQ